MRKIIIAIFVITSFLISSCDTNGGTVDLTVNETSAEITETTTETIHMNNCGSTGEVKQTAEKSKSVNVEYAGSLGVDKVVINGEVSAKYGEVNANAKKIELVVPAGTDMMFNLVWTEKTWVGVVTAQGKDGLANYKVSVPISVELVSSQNLGCPLTQIPSVGTTIQSTSTVAPIACSDIQPVQSRVFTGQQKKEFTVTLGDGEVIVGQGWQFWYGSAPVDKCTAFIIDKSGTYTFSIYDGAWSYYKVCSSSQAESLLQGEKDSLGKYCNPVITSRIP